MLQADRAWFGLFGTSSPTVGITPASPASAKITGPQWSHEREVTETLTTFQAVSGSDREGQTAAARMTKAQRVTSSVLDVTGWVNSRANTNCVYTTPFSSVNSKDLWLSSFAEKEHFPNQLLLHPLEYVSERQCWCSDYCCCFQLSTPAHLKKQARGRDFRLQLGRWIKMVYSFKKTIKTHF